MSAAKADDSIHSARILLTWADNLFVGGGNGLIVSAFLWFPSHGCPLPLPNGIPFYPCDSDPIVSLFYTYCGLDLPVAEELNARQKGLLSVMAGIATINDFPAISSRHLP